MRVFNFAAGPATLPLEVLEQAKAEMTDWKSSGMSVMEVSHRSKAFIAVAQQAEADLRELLSIPANYKVLFLQGGATGMFSAIPMNLASADSTVDYVNTGAWSKKAIGENQAVRKVNRLRGRPGNQLSPRPRPNTPGVRISTTRQRRLRRRGIRLCAGD
jgi:phosphoserine aminotransferase